MPSRTRNDAHDFRSVADLHTVATKTIRIVPARRVLWTAIPETPAVRTSCKENENDARVMAPVEKGKNFESAASTQYFSEDRY